MVGVLVGVLPENIAHTNKSRSCETTLAGQAAGVCIVPVAENVGVIKMIDRMAMLKGRS